MNNDIKDLLNRYMPGYEGSVEQVTGSGSNRIYLRLQNDSLGTFMAVYGSCVAENRAFVNMARHFASQGLPVPHLIGDLSDDGHFYLQEDLGPRSLFDVLAEGRRSGGDYSESERRLLHRTIALLPDMQFLGMEGFDPSWCYPKPYFDRQGILFDFNYFKYCFLKAVVPDLDEVLLEQEFDKLAGWLLEEDGLPQVFLYRDFQARNVMIDPSGNPRFIDFQGGRVGPVYYDLASFLWQAASRYPLSLRDELIDTYLQHAKRYLGNLERGHFDERLQLFVLFRLMQVLGAYGFRGYFERKSHFLLSIPPAIANLMTLLATKSGVWDEIPYLHGVLSYICTLPQFASLPKKEGLVVRVFSFSYKKGIPEDLSGNGGGYVFDCRSTHNPGRYAEYKQLTGLDEPVIRFLEEDGEITTFLQSVYALADAHVTRYIERGFTDLMFAFGCTGGQHRSVYSAEHLAHYLHEKYGIQVELTHREQGIYRRLERRLTSDIKE